MGCVDGNEGGGSGSVEGELHFGADHVGVIARDLVVSQVELLDTVQFDGCDSGVELLVLEKR